MPLPLSPRELGESNSTAKLDVGALVEVKNKVYIYVLRDSIDATTLAANKVLTYKAIASSDIYLRKVTMDISAGSSTHAAGVSVSANLTANEYGFILKRGACSALATNGDDDIANGDLIVPDGSTDGACDSYLVDAASNGNPTDAELQALQRNVTVGKVGIAIDDDVDASNTVNTYVDVLL